MQAGRLDRRITIQRRVATLDEHGQPREEWQTLAYRRPARYVAPRGSERFADAQVVARTAAEFYIRYSQDVASLDPTCRLIYPAIEGVTEPPERSVFDILEAVEVGGRRREIRITAQNRADRPQA